MIRLIAGLGNDDRRYHLTFHNAGHWALDTLAQRLHLEARESKDNTLYRHPADVTLAKPRSYMNLCGPRVREALMRCGGNPADLLVVSDDFALPEGRLRFRRGGSAGGHNGLKSVIEFLGTGDFPRLRIGVGPVPEGVDPADYVLRKVAVERMGALADKAADALAFCIAEGLDAAMNRFNAAS